MCARPCVPGHVCQAAKKKPGMCDNVHGRHVQQSVDGRHVQSSVRQGVDGRVAHTESALAVWFFALCSQLADLQLDHRWRVQYTLSKWSGRQAPLGCSNMLLAEVASAHMGA
eukprot:1159982-Pelagomonas_calceolata.AAC.4